MWLVKDVRSMMKWFDEAGLGADVEGVKRLHPGAMGLGEWIKMRSAWAK
jgi:hypothetical protein